MQSDVCRLAVVTDSFAFPLNAMNGIVPLQDAFTPAVVDQSYYQTDAWRTVVVCDQVLADIADRDPLSQE
eukprot:656806-Prorocentrum_lima.AAC.1